MDLHTSSRFDDRLHTLSFFWNRSNMVAWQSFHSQALNTIWWIYFCLLLRLLVSCYTNWKSLLYRRIRFILAQRQVYILFACRVVSLHSQIQCLYEDDLQHSWHKIYGYMWARKNPLQSIRSSKPHKIFPIRLHTVLPLYLWNSCQSFCEEAFHVTHVFVNLLIKCDWSVVLWLHCHPLSLIWFLHFREVKPAWLDYF